MTIEFNPGRAVAAQTGTTTGWSAKPAQDPEVAEIVALITELFAEGVLSGNQLAVIGGTTEMQQMLGDTITRLEAAE